MPNVKRDYDRRVNFYLPQAEYDWLHTRMRADDTTLSSILRNLVRAAMAEDDPPASSRRAARGGSSGTYAGTRQDAAAPRVRIRSAA